jgi:hypothetical protein
VLTNSNNRNLFLRLISNKKFVSEGSRIKSSRNYLFWLNIRQVKVRIIHIHCFKDRFCLEIISLLSEVQQLELTQCDLLQHEIYGYFPKLSVLMIGARYYSSTELLNLLNNCANLQKLHIGEMEPDQVLTSTMSDDACTTNMSLALLTCDRVTVKDNLLCKVFDHNIYLLTVNFTQCPRITDLTLQYLGRLCKNLKSLLVAHCPSITDQGLMGLSEQCCSLTGLTLVENRQINQWGMACLVGFNTLLTALSICSTNKENSFSLTDSLVICPFLRTLSLQKFIALTDCDLKGVVDCQGLTALDITNCIAVTDHGLDYISHRCGTSLVSLSVSGCFLFTDNSICALPALCAVLTHLDVSYCYHLTDRAVCAVLSGCVHLKSLAVEACLHLSPRGLAPLLMTAFKEHVESDCERIDEGHLFVPNLEHLNVSRCALITVNVVQQLRTLRGGAMEVVW